MATVETIEERPAISTPSRGIDSKAWPRVAFLVGLVALLPAEVVVVTLCFAPGQGVGAGTWWSEVVRISTYLPRIGLQFVLPSALCGIFIAALLRRLPAKLFLGEDAVRSRLPLIGVHTVALTVFVVLTWQISSGACQTSGFPGLIVASWAFAGVVLAACWTLAILPASAWWGLAGPLTVAITVGTAMTVVGIAVGGASQELWRSFNQATFWTSHAILSAVFPETHCDPANLMLGIGQFQVRITPACSGFEGIGLITVFLVGYLFVFRRTLRFPHAIILLPIGIGLIWLLNSVRIAGLVALGAWVSPAVAIEGFHSQAGWLAFNAVGLGVVAVSHRLDFFGRGKADSLPGEGVNPTVPYLLPFVVLMGALMVCAAFSAGFDYLYPAKVLAVGLTIWWFRREYSLWSWTWSWFAVGIGAAVFFIWMALEFALNPQPTDAVTAETLDQMPASLAVGWLIVRVLGSVVTVPIAEELAFRGFLIRRLQSADFQSVAPSRFTWISFLLSSVLFGLLHDRWVAGTLAGAFFALALYRRGRISDAVLAHATTNALIAAYVLSTGSWSLW